MAVFQLTEEIGFPDPELANDDGLLAVDGDLSSERILLAYSQGIFPWYSKDYRILWWSPNPRLILYPSKLIKSKSLVRTIKSNKYSCKFDTNFEAVIKECAKIPRGEGNETWLVNEMVEAYIELHKQGFAHSVETYYNNELVGGLYGISLGKVFFGESMFFKKSDASKVALSYLCTQAEAMGFYFIDAQVETDHLIRMGAEKIKRSDFLELLDQALEHATCQGKWTEN
ncbi:MAG: leucyl/phenylalanyl-tRNA--protein transferase [Bacteroidales bacterium]|jgi:leucyl/phenylalanyl-tRNA--protein transferase|nr:leucyl/phenylalanyl-tRNA--protein transferase [Bacteroidales bacterium]